MYIFILNLKASSKSKPYVLHGTFDSHMLNIRWYSTLHISLNRTVSSYMRAVIMENYFINLALKTSVYNYSYVYTKNIDTFFSSKLSFCLVNTEVFNIICFTKLLSSNCKQLVLLSTGIRICIFTMLLKPYFKSTGVVFVFMITLLQREVSFSVATNVKITSIKKKEKNCLLVYEATDYISIDIWYLLCLVVV